MNLLTLVGTLSVYVCLCASTPVRSSGKKLTVQSHPMLASLFNTANTVQQIELSNREFGAGKARNRAGKGTGTIKKIPMNFEKPIELLPIVAPGLKPIRGTKEVFKGTSTDSSSIVADTTKIICSYCQEIQNATCIEIYCFNNGQAASSSVFIPIGLSKVLDNNLNIVPPANIQNEVSVMSNSINRPQMVGGPIFSQLETNEGNLHQELGIPHTGHGIMQPAKTINHPGHGMKHQGHGISHPGQGMNNGIKQQGHGINHPGQGVNSPVHGIKLQGHGINHPGQGVNSPVHGIKQQGHGINHPGQGVNSPVHGIKLQGHGINHLGQGINSPVHGITLQGHGINHPGQRINDPVHGIKQQGHGISRPGHGIDNPLHGMKLQGHGINHPRHDIKQPEHAINHPGLTKKQSEHALDHPGHGIKQQGHEINHPGHVIKQSTHGINHPEHGINNPGHEIKQSSSGIKHSEHGIRQPGHGIKHPTHGIKHPEHEMNLQQPGINHHGSGIKHAEGHKDSSHQFGMLSTENGHSDIHGSLHVNNEHPNSAMRKRPELNAVDVNQGLSPTILDSIEPLVNDVHHPQAKPVAPPTDIHHDPLQVDIAAVIPLDSNVHHHQGTETLPLEPGVISNPVLLPEHVVAAIVPQDMLQRLPVQSASLEPVADKVNSGVLHEGSGPGLVIVGTGPFILEQPSNTVVDAAQGNLETVIRDHVPQLDGSESLVQQNDLIGHSGPGHHDTLSGGSGLDIGQIKSEPLFPEQSTNANVGADQINPAEIAEFLGLDPAIVGDQRQVNPVQQEAHIHNNNVANHLPVESITNDHSAIHHGSDISAHSGEHTAHGHSSFNTGPTQQKSATAVEPTSSSGSVVHSRVSSVASDTLPSSNLQSDLFANTGQLPSLERVLIDARNLQQAVLNRGAVNNVQSSIGPGTLEVLPDNNQPVNIPGARPFDAMNPLTGNDVIAQVPASNPAMVQVPSAQNFQSLKPHLSRAGVQRVNVADRRQEGQDQTKARTSLTGRDGSPFVTGQGNPILTFSKLYNIPKVVKVSENETPNLGTGVPGQGMARSIDSRPQGVADQGWVQKGSTVAPTIVTLSPERKAELNALSKVFLSNVIH